MNKFEDFIKENTKFDQAPNQSELDHLKNLTQSRKLNLKVLFATLSSAAVVLIFVLSSFQPNQKPIVSDLTAEDYMSDVFFAVEEESLDSDLDEFTLL